MFDKRDFPRPVAVGLPPRSISSRVWSRTMLGAMAVVRVEARRGSKVPFAIEDLRAGADLLGLTKDIRPWQEGEAAPRNGAVFALIGETARIVADRATGLA